MPLLLFTDWFTPGYRAGGPIQSAHNFALGMQRHYAIKVLSSDRDLDALAPYAGIQSEVWLPFQQSGVEVLYAALAQLSMGRVWRYIREVHPRYVYLNSMFSWQFSLCPLLLYRLGLYQARVVLAPRGMLKASALQFKARKKQVFLRLFRWSGLPQRIVFHASDAQEKKDIERVFGPRCKIVVIPSFPAPVLPQAQPKVKNAVTRFVFLGRVHPIKNLHVAIAAIASSTAPAELYIIGSTEDAGYWQQCQQQLAAFPAQVQVHYLGELPHPQVREKLLECDFLLLPTQGENFGHAIFECFAAGVPVIISDQTPWQNLREREVGWSLPLDRVEGFAEAVQEAVAMSAQEYARWSARAQGYAQDFVREARLEEAYQELFC